GGTVAPDSAGRNSTPSAPAGACAAWANRPAWSVPSTDWAHHSVQPPDTNPGFSTSSSPVIACAWVSTTRSPSKTGSAPVTATGSAVPVTSAPLPGTIAPAPTQAACSSPVPVTTAQSVVSPSSAAASGVSVPAGSAE